MTLIGNKVFADVIRGRVKMGSYWVKLGPNSNESVLMRQKRMYGDTQRR